MTRSAWLVLLLTLLLTVRPAAEQTLPGAALVNALRQGGYVLVMRHTSSPREAPTARRMRALKRLITPEMNEGRRTSVALRNRIFGELSL